MKAVSTIYTNATADGALRMYTQAFLLMLLLCAASARAAVSSDAMSSRRAELRRACAMATQSREHAEKMLEDLDEVTESEPLAYGYRAMAEFLISHHSYNPVTKYRRFTSAKETLEKAVQAAPDLPELRYLRFTIQSRLPSMLPYREHLEADKDFLLQYLCERSARDDDNELNSNIRNSLLASPLCTGADKERLRRVR